MTARSMTRRGRDATMCPACRCPLLPKKRVKEAALEPARDLGSMTKLELRRFARLALAIPGSADRVTREQSSICTIRLKGGLRNAFRNTPGSLRGQKPLPERHVERSPWTPYR